MTEPSSSFINRGVSIYCSTSHLFGRTGFVCCSTMTQKSFVRGDECPALEPGTVRVYSMRFCPYAQRTRLVLEHKKLPFETVNVSLKEKPEWFTCRNPLGKVPVLELDGKILYESSVTSDYLDDIFPDDRLTPSDPYRRAKDKILLEAHGRIEIIAYTVLSEESYRMHSEINVTAPYYAILRIISGQDGDLEKSINDFRNGLKPFEEALNERGNFFGGDKPAMLDYMTWPHLERVPAFKILLKGTDLILKDSFPALSAWMERMLDLEPVKRTVFDAETHAQFFESHFKGTPNFDIGL